MGVRSPHVEEWCSKEMPLCSALCRIGRRMVADRKMYLSFSHRNLSESPAFPPTYFKHSFEKKNSSSTRNIGSWCPIVMHFYYILFWGRGGIYYSTLLHLPPLRFHCADGCWDRTQDHCNWCIGSQTL
jgi:hypothetical protein